MRIGWDLKIEFSKINYRVYTDTIKEILMTTTLFPQEMVYPYASEAEVLNMALSGKTAVLWRSEKK